MLKSLLFASLAVGVSALPTAEYHANLNVKLSIASGLLRAPTDGRIVLMFAPNGTDPLDDTDVTSSPNKIFGKNVYGLSLIHI